MIILVIVGTAIMFFCVGFYAGMVFTGGRSSGGTADDAQHYDKYG